MLRQVLASLLPGSDTPEALLARLKQVERGLEPEDEFSLILTWLGKCRLVHKLCQEQLPLASVDTYRVPDLIAAFEYDKRIVPVLIEVKKREPKNPASLDSDSLSLNGGYLRYAELLSLPMLVAWKYRGFWTLFEMQHAKLAAKNYKIDFDTAMKENLLGPLAGDFLYRLAPGTRIRVRIRKLTEPDSEGGFDGEVTDAHFENPLGERVPEIPHLLSLFLFWDSDGEVIEEGNYVVQSFVVPEVEIAEFASRTLSRIMNAWAGMKQRPVNWRAIIHDASHFAHNSGQLHSVLREGARYGVVTDLSTLHPSSPPSFL